AWQLREAAERHDLGGVPLAEVDAVDEAEDLFDSFVGHMSGRKQPTEFPEPGQWRLLIGAARRYHTAAPWRRWPPDWVELLLELHHDSRVDRYVASVLGHERIQRGLVICPGR